jgi:hypothetical protein
MQLLSHIGQDSLEPAKVTIMGCPVKSGNFEKASQFLISVESVSKINAQIARKISGVSQQEGKKGPRRNDHRGGGGRGRNSGRGRGRQGGRYDSKSRNTFKGELDGEKTYSAKDFYSMSEAQRATLARLRAASKSNMRKAAAITTEDDADDEYDSSAQFGKGAHPPKKKKVKIS